MKASRRKYSFLILYFISYMSFSFCMTKFTPYLSSLGYDAMYRGIIISGYAITTIVFQLLFGFLSDRFQSVKKIILVAVTGLGLSSVLLFQNGLGMFAAQLLLISLSGGLVNSLCGMYDTWVLGVDHEMQKSLSFIKAFGSVGWALGSVIASQIIAKFMYSGLGVSVLILAGLSILNVVLLPDIQSVERKEKIKLQDVLQLFHIPGYTLLVFILFLMYAVVVANSCTVIDKMIALKATDFEISLKFAFGSLLEIPTYLAGAYLLKKFKAIHLLHFSAAMMTIQFMLFALANQAGAMIIISLLQIFSTPIILIASKMIILEISPDYLRNSSQLIALSIFMGVSSLMIPSIAGFFGVRVGFNITLAGVAMLGVLSFVLIFWLKHIFHKHNIVME